MKKSKIKETNRKRNKNNNNNINKEESENVREFLELRNLKLGWKESEAAAAGNGQRKGIHQMKEAWEGGREHGETIRNNRSCSKKTTKWKQ